MIKYFSTRGEIKGYSFSQAVLKGIAGDGGLFAPKEIPHFTLEQLKKLIGKSYQQQAEFILGLFKTDFSSITLKEIIKKAYSDNFDTPFIAPIVQLKNSQYIQELWHGPTSAFKDMALQLTPLLFSEAIKLNKAPFKYLILTATSGDTGKAALEGFKDKKGTFIIVFYPKGHVSKLQELQMITQEGLNVYVCGIKGDFDTVQKLVKEIFADKEFNEILTKQYKTVLSSANSINWGRLIPQIIYHIAGYLELVRIGKVKLGDKIDICVPTGNFGNILAAFYAKIMGLPINKLICASNENNILTEFLNTGVYDIRKRQLIQTPSPSMDILVASNIERLLYAITQNPKKVIAWMNDLKDKGKFEVDDEVKKILKKKFYADWVSNENCLQNIKKVFEEIKYLMDPHTSCAQVVAERYINKMGVTSPIIICSTAYWAKFAKDVYRALIGDNFQGDALERNEFRILEEVCKLSPETFIPESIKSLNSKKIRFEKNSEANLDLVKILILNILS